MKIYQLHEYSGEWEDFTDNICGSYLRKERAEEAKADAETRERELLERGQQCINCPFLNNHSFLNIKNLIAKYPDYCTDAKLEESDYGIDCENYYAHWDKSTFEIKEVEVEE